jgi:hypothetical protein
MREATEKLYTTWYGDTDPVDQDNTCDICGLPVNNGSSMCDECRMAIFRLPYKKKETEQ